MNPCAYSPICDDNKRRLDILAEALVWIRDNAGHCEVCKKK